MNQGKRVNSEQNICIIRCPGGGGETAPFRPAFALAMLTVAAAAALFTLPPNLVVNAQGGAIALPTLLQAARCGSGHAARDDCGSGPGRTAPDAGR